MLIVVISNLAVLLFCYKRILRYLHALQQDEYSISRFYQWFISNKAFDQRGTIVALIVVMTSWVSPWIGFDWFFSVLGCSAFFIGYLWEYDPRKKGKLLLNMTPRATRIFCIAILFVSLHGLVTTTVLFVLTDSSIHHLWFLHLITIQLVPVYTALAIASLKPYERYVSSKFVSDAKNKILRANARTIAITGSFGKSSVKNALGEILQTTLGSTFWPSGGVNTLMGITTHIRERLSPHHDNMIIEMAAYRKGSIASLCEFTPPQAGIITAIGAMHLERFGSLEAIYQAKTELARAIPQDGILVCNGDDKGARRAAKENPKKFTYLYGLNNEKEDLSCHVSSLRFSEKGSHFTLHWKNTSYEGFTQLLGRPAISNLMGVFTMACALGADPHFVIAAIANLKPMNNRLSIERADEQLFLMDAYNSNPTGFKAALEVLDTVAKGRKVLITPGMVELGELQYQENHDIATDAATICDIILFVGETNLSAFKSGLEASKFPEDNFRTYAHRNDALADLKILTEPGDTILIENDLPDLYEGTPSF